LRAAVSDVDEFTRGCRLHTTSLGDGGMASRDSSERGSLRRGIATSGKAGEARTPTA
jgi:hypothetical protein